MGYPLKNCLGAVLKYGFDKLFVLENLAFLRFKAIMAFKSNGIKKLRNKSYSKGKEKNHFEKNVHFKNILPPQKK